MRPSEAVEKLLQGIAAALLGTREPVAQPDPHEAAALAQRWLDAPVNPRDFFGDEMRLSVRALLRERETAAERSGAEAMREKIAQEAGRWSHIYASEVRALPLPGDKQGE